VQEGKVPNLIVVEFTLPQKPDNMMVEIFFLKHPKNWLWCKDIAVKYIFIFNKIDYFLFVTWSENIVKRLKLVNSQIRLNLDVWRRDSFSYNSWPSASIARINRILPHCWNIELSFEFFRCVFFQQYVHYLSIFVTNERNTSFWNIEKDLKL
jgi:hypothetical protein